ncbi:MAG: polysaccharide deacetylase family protein [Pirellulales bacterium]|nr:polysaccharide deacetylase family protein [Pirellulales bacterium]
MRANKDNSFGILNYHRVAPRVAGVLAPTWNVTPARLRNQLAGLIERGHRPWPLRRVLECRLCGEAVPAGIFVVTFDDAYDNVYHNAWPVLKELSVPATVFVTTAYLDGRRPFPFDDWPAAGSDAAPELSWRPLTAAHCAEMMESGLVEIGSHTHTHADLRGQPELFRRDLTRSIDALRERFGLRAVCFAYPFGYHCAKITAVARRSGVRCALTTEPKIVAPGEDRFSWGRFNVGRFDTPATLSMKLHGWYAVVHGLRRRLRPLAMLFNKKHPSGAISS